MENGVAVGKGERLDDIDGEVPISGNTPEDWVISRTQTDITNPDGAACYQFVLMGLLY